MMDDVKKKMSDIEDFLADFLSLYPSNQGVYGQLRAWFDVHCQPYECRRRIGEWIFENVTPESNDDWDMVEHALFIASCISELDYEGYWG